MCRRARVAGSIPNLVLSQGCLDIGGMGLVDPRCDVFWPCDLCAASSWKAVLPCVCRPMEDVFLVGLASLSSFNWLSS